MYGAFFGLGEAPFRITPDPRFLHLDPAVEAALQAVEGGIRERAGLILLVGEVGTGKTTLVRRLLDTLPPAVRTVLVLHPTVTFEETLDHILLELGVPVASGDRDVLLERLADFLRAHAHDGGSVAVFFDEAQALREATLAALPSLLDAVRVAGRPVMQVILAGQPELDERLATPAVVALRGRVSVTARLAPLAPEAVGGYVRARLAHARARDPELFTPDALARLAAVSGGVPRLINVLCESALLAAYAEGRSRIDAGLIDAVWADYEPLHRPEGTPMPAPAAVPAAPPGKPPPPPPAPGRARRRALLAAGVAVALALAALVLLGQPGRPVLAPEPPPAEPPPAAALPAPPPLPPEVEEEPAEDVAAPARPASPSTVDAIELADRFWAAYAMRDTDRLRALFAAEAVPAGPIFDLDPTGGGALVTPTGRLEAKPAGDRVTVRVPFELDARDDRGRAVRRQGVASLQVAMRDGAPRIVALDAASGPAPRR